MNVEMIEVKKLVKSPLNARKTVSKAACEELKASLLAHGLLQNLVAVPAKKGKYHVIAGARRLAALQSLIEEGKLPADHAVPCQIVDEEHAAERSLAENTVRHAMHPADEFEAFAALVEQGQNAAEVAERFGVEEKHVLKRLKLGKVAPELLAEYREGKINLEALMAFTVTDDRKRQFDLYRSLQGWQKDNASHIRGCLTEKLTEASDKLAKFVGLDAYQAAGGNVRADLFGEEIYLEDSALLNRLAGEKLDAEAVKLRAEGWGWVEAMTDCDYSATSRHGRIQPVPLNAPADLVTALEEAEAEQTRIAELIDAAHESEDSTEELFEELEGQLESVERGIEVIEETLASYTDFDPEQKKLAGCIVSVTWGGKLAIEKGLVKAEAKKQLAKATGESSGAAPEADDRPGYSQSLIDDLKAYRLGVAQAEIARNPALALDLLVFKAAKSVIGISRAYDGPDVSFQLNGGGCASGEARRFVKDQMVDIGKALPLDWVELDSQSDQFAALQSLTGEQKHAILAYCVARTIQPKLAPFPDDGPSGYDIALSQTSANVAEYWRPTAENFLSRLKSGQLLEISEEVFGPQWATHRRNSKKAALVSELDKAFADPEAQGKTPEQVEKLRDWLPERMGFEIGEVAA